MMKSQEKLKYEDIEKQEFEELLEEELLDIEMFLESYTVNKVSDEKIEETIEVLKSYIPAREIEYKKEKESIVSIIKENIELIKLQFNFINKWYFVLALVLILLGTITTIKYNMSIYTSASVVAPIPILLGIFEIIKGREENMWELELSYKYSLREIILSRLVIINIISVVVGILMSILLKDTYSEASLLKVVSIWLTPIFIISSTSLIITSIYRSVNSIAICISIWMISILSISVYEKVATIENINISAVLIVSIVMTILSSKIFYNKSICSLDYKAIDM